MAVKITSEIKHFTIEDQEATWWWESNKTNYRNPIYSLCRCISGPRICYSICTVTFINNNNNNNIKNLYSAVYNLWYTLRESEMVIVWMCM